MTDYKKTAVPQYDRFLNFMFELNCSLISKERLSGVVSVILDHHEELASSDWNCLKNCSSSVKFSLCAGLLGVHKVEDLAYAKSHGKCLLDGIFTFLAFETGR